jgi:hypothetical protein
MKLVNIKYFSGVDIFDVNNLKLFNITIFNCQRSLKKLNITDEIGYDIYEKIESEITDYIYDGMFWWNEYQ